MLPGDDPDVQLMLAVQAGNEDAFRELYQKYSRQVVRFAMQFVGTQARAEELAQDVFLQVYRARRSYQPKARFSTWMYRIATNACLSEVRRPEQRNRPISLDEPPAGLDPETPPEWADPEAVEGESVARGAELKARAVQILEGLPPQQKAAILLARVEGLAYEEVAEALDCSVSAVKSLVHRATVAMRDGLREFIEPEERG